MAVHHLILSGSFFNISSNGILQRHEQNAYNIKYIFFHAKRAWSSPVLINLTLVDTAAGKSTTVQEGCREQKKGLTCKTAWQNSFGPS
jgi:hypothetical protein